MAKYDKYSYTVVRQGKGETRTYHVEALFEAEDNISQTMLSVTEALESEIVRNEAGKPV